ncbi:MAG TPA: S1/P1 nuclease [Gemmataceae bacterium]|nr:S1/P1 nuclease [Gemmataceae bacterium]
MIRYLPAALIVLSITAPRVSAWNAIGHMVVSKLAYNQLDAKRQVALYKLLKNHPHYKEFLAAGRPTEIESEVEWVVLRSSVWPDWIRPRKNDKRGVSTYHRGEEHYVTNPFIDPKDAKLFFAQKFVNPDTASIITALKQRSNDLKTKNASLEDRAVAACWIFHLVGDIHQPLHNASYFSNAPAFKNGDLGGNKFAIKADGRKWRLHTYWDDLLGEDSDYSDDSSAHQTALYREAIKVAESLRGIKLTDADKTDLEKNLTFESWSREGFELAKSVCYRKGDGSGLLTPVEAKFNGAIPDEAEEVGKQYIQNARALAERRVTMAGKRLADRLRDLLTP